MGNEKKGDKEKEREPDGWKEGGNPDNTNKSYRDYVQEGEDSKKKEGTRTGGAPDKKAG